jgi:enoyl-CoA hydratase/carnithine racemase
MTGSHFYFCLFASNLSHLPRREQLLAAAQSCGMRGPHRDPRREAQASKHRHQADVAGLQLAGHRLSGAQRHQAGLLDGLAPATEVQERRADEAGLLDPEANRTTTRRMGQQREAEAMGWMARNTGSQRPTAAARPGRRSRLRQPLRAPRWMGQCWCGARPCLGSAPFC